VQNRRGVRVHPALTFGMTLALNVITATFAPGVVVSDPGSGRFNLMPPVEKSMFAFAGVVGITAPVPSVTWTLPASVSAAEAHRGS